MKKISASIPGTSLDGLLLTAVKVMTMGLGLITTRLLSQYLSVYDYGTYSLVQLVISTTASITILGMMDGINYFFCRERDVRKRESYIATIYLMQFSVSLLAGCAIMCASGRICSYLGNPGAETLMIYAAILPFLQNILAMTQVLMLSVGKAKVLAVRNLMISLLRLLTVIFVVAFIKQVAAILFVTCILDAGQIAVFFLMLKNNGCVIHLRAFAPRLLKRIIHYCFPMAVFILLNSINRDCDKYVIAAMTDTETLAIYTNASKVLPFDMITASFTTVLLPKITKLISAGKKQEAVQLYQSFLEISYISTGILACGAIAAAPQLMRLLYTEKYLSGLIVFVLYIVVDILRVTNITLLLSASGKTKTLMILAVASILTNLGLNICLFHLLGMMGPAIATLFVTLLTGSLMLYWGAKVLAASIASFFDFRYLAKFVSFSIIAMLLLVLVRKLLERLGFSYFFILLLIFGVYCLSGILVNFKRFLNALKRMN